LSRTPQSHPVDEQSCARASNDQRAPEGALLGKSEEDIAALLRTATLRRRRRASIGAEDDFAVVLQDDE
jgi:hypothetical protein